MPLILEKTPLQLFSKSLVRLKFLQLIQKDLEKIETSKKSYKVNFLNQSYIFHLVAMWQVFIEEQVQYGIKEMSGLSPLGLFEPILKSKVKHDLRRYFNTPNRHNIDKIFEQFLGINKISQAWTWEGMTRNDALKLLEKILEIRHDIAHQSRTQNNLSFDKNYEYMGHLYNLAYLISYETEKHLAFLLEKEFAEPIIIPYPTTTLVI